ncbi:MAG: STT3 domain-containing protein, partial [bacterium]
MASRRAIFTYTVLALIVVGALVLRTAWTIPAAREAGTFVLGESDAYYHKRGVDHAQEDWTQLRADPMLNYPIGDVNPNPPFSDWIVAAGGVVAAPLWGGDTDEATWWLFMYEPSFFAALAAIPVFLITRRLVGTAGGLAAAFLLATSIQNMNRSHLGFSDHDSMQLFFTVLGFYFVLRALDLSPSPGEPRDPGGLLRDWPGWLKDTNAGGYAVLAGASFGALALIWKGFPYAFGVLLVFAVVQMVLDHGRRRDVSHTVYAVTTPLVVALLMAAPYYFGFGLANFFTPALFLAAVVL